VPYPLELKIDRDLMVLATWTTVRQNPSSDRPLGKLWAVVSQYLCYFLDCELIASLRLHDSTGCFQNAFVEPIEIFGESHHANLKPARGGMGV
jgi:hypothetical protein